MVTPGRPLSEAEVEELLGAYALDALGPEEALAVEAHLRTCEQCRSELALHRSTLARLTPVGREPPPGVWDRIAAELPSSPSVPDVPLGSGGDGSGARRAGGPAGPARARPRRRTAAAMALAGVAAAVLVGVAISLGGDDRRRPPSSPGGVEQLAEAARQDDASRSGRLVSPNGSGSLAVDVVMQQGGQGYLSAVTLPALGPGLTYQLWSLQGGRALSLGVLGPRFDTVGFTAAGPVEQLALSVEAVPGSVEPQGQVVAAGTLSV